MARYNGNERLPELLAPAGSPEALDAAIEAGADAVYFGGAMYSNRMRAKNFDKDELISAIRKCNIYGVASYVTMNTRLRDPELKDALETARTLWDAGVTAFIVADVGFASLIREHIPTAHLHASTQMTGVNSDDAAALAALGFERMVCPRELSVKEIGTLVRESPIEIEMFIHGAHCVSVSGQCLMSWAMGGRSGNRGECAQPCRLPYKLCGVKSASSHPLSLKDMCLAAHIPSLIESGVSSLKIEGRLKSADYVYGVTRIYRRLLDEGRSATLSEMRELESIFSRDGFTDGYFKGSLKGMNGMRPEGEKSCGPDFTSLTRKVPVTAHARVRVGDAATLTLSCRGVTVTATGDAVQAAKTSPVTEEFIYKNVSKLGGEAFSLEASDFVCDTDDASFMTTAQINGLRRQAVSLLTEAIASSEGRAVSARPSSKKNTEQTKASPIRTAEFTSARQVPESAYGYFDVIFLPEGEIVGEASDVIGLSLPPYTPSTDRLKDSLRRFKSAGGKYTLAHSYSQITLSVEAGLIPIASLRLNVTGRASADVIGEMGARHVILSPELKAAAMRDVARRSAISCGAVVYGKLPLMLLRRCLMADYACSGNCGGAGCILPHTMSDRRGADLTLLPIGDRMNLIVNPHPIWSADRQSETSSLGISHFIFADESASEANSVIRAYKAGLAPDAAGAGQIKRL